MRQRSVVPHSFLAIALAGALAQAQTPCAGSVQALELPAGLDGELRDSIYWDRDGAGPLPAELVIAGAFRRIGGVVVNGIARKDAVLGWQPLGSGVDGAVRCLAIDGANRLVLGGSFTYAGGVTAPRIARFDGAQYSALMSPPPALSGTVVALAPIGATAMNYIEQSGLGYFDGTAVYGVALGGVAPGIPGSAIDIARLPNGDLLVAGSFTSLAGQPASNIAVYRSGANTVDPLQGGTNTTVRKVEALPNGDFYAFGPFGQVAGAATAGVARFASNAWTTYPSTGMLSSVQGGGVDAAGQPVAFGSSGLSQYVNGAWQLLLVNGRALHVNGLAGGGLLVGNDVASDTLVVPVGYLPGYGFTLQGGTASALADGLVGSIERVAERPDGSILAYIRANPGVTPIVGGQPVPGGFARYAAGAWTALPTGPMPVTSTGTMGNVYAVLPQSGGSFVAVGDFATIGGAAIANAARFDGTSWQPLGGGPAGAIDAAVLMPNGDLVAVLRIDESIQRFDGSAWQTVAPSVPGTSYSGLLACRDGSFLVHRNNGAAFGPTRFLDRFYGSTVFTTATPELTNVSSMAELRDGTIAIGGSTTVGTVVRFNGTSIQPIGTLPNYFAPSVCALPDGGVAAIVWNAPTTPISRQAMRWTGSVWTPLTAFGATAVLSLRNGGVLMAGSSRLDATRAAAIARFDSGCPSASTAIASGCSIAAGALASDAPWLGQTLQLRATGLPDAAFAIAVGSTQAANLPLAGVFSTAIPGCALLVQPDVTSAQLAVAGTAQLAFAIPNAPALVGAAFRQQFVHFALDPSLAIGATNALDLVVGSY